MLLHKPACSLCLDLSEWFGILSRAKLAGTKLAILLKQSLERAEFDSFVSGGFFPWSKPCSFNLRVAGDTKQSE